MNKTFLLLFLTHGEDLNEGNGILDIINKANNKINGNAINGVFTYSLNSKEISVKPIKAEAAPGEGNPSK